MLLVDFSQRRDPNSIARMLGCNLSMLETLLLPRRQDLYQLHKIPKRNGRGYRMVYEPASDLSTVQKGFVNRFEYYMKSKANGYPHPAVHGFIQGKSTKTNAKEHCGSIELLRLDIYNFFQSISQKRIEDVFKRFQVDEVAIPYLSGLVTIPSNLVEGSPSSPFIANLVALELDYDLAQLANRYGVTYTRYADDLTFSLHRKFGQLPTIDHVCEELSRHGFNLAPEKTRRSKPGQAHFVTGLSVQIPSGPTLPKKAKRAMRQELYYARKYGIREHAEKVFSGRLQYAVNQIEGRLSYFSGVEPQKWKAEIIKWHEQLKSEGIYPDYKKSRFLAPGFAAIVVDESEVQVHGIKYIALAAVELRSSGKEFLYCVREELGRIAAAYGSDPYAAGRTAHLSKNGLHYCDDPKDLQAKVIEHIAAAPIEIYMAYARRSSNSYQSDYLRLLKSLLRGRLAARNRDLMEIILEENPAVSSDAVRGAIDDIQYSATRGKKIDIVVSSKLNEPLLALADYALGVFFAQRGGDQMYTRRFERLRHRFRYITNLSAGLRFNKRNPIKAFADGFTG